MAGGMGGHGFDAPLVPHELRELEGLSGVPQLHRLVACGCQQLIIILQTIKERLHWNNYNVVLLKDSFIIDGTCEVSFLEFCCW